MAISIPLRNADWEPKFREWLMPMTRRSLREMARMTSSRVVRAAVVDEDDLEVDVELGERRLEPFVHDRDRQVVLVAGDDGADAVNGVEAVFLGRSAGSAACRAAAWYQCDRSAAGLPRRSVRGSQPRRSRALAMLAYQSWTSQRRCGMVKRGLARDVEELRAVCATSRDRGLAAGADVERLAVSLRAQVQCRVDERLGHVVDVDEIARDRRVDELGVSSAPGRGGSGWESSRAESSSGPKTE